MKVYTDDHDCLDYEDHRGRCAGCHAWITWCIACKEETTVHALDPCPGVD